MTENSLEDGIYPKLKQCYLKKFNKYIKKRDANIETPEK